MEENNDNTNGYKRVEKLNIFYPADIITYMNKNIGNDSLLEVSYYLTGPEGKKMCSPNVTPELMDNIRKVKTPRKRVVPKLGKAMNKINGLEGNIELNTPEYWRECIYLFKLFRLYVDYFKISAAFKMSVLDKCRVLINDLPKKMRKLKRKDKEIYKKSKKFIILFSNDVKKTEQIYTNI